MFKKDKEIIIKFLVLLFIALIPFQGANAGVFNPFAAAGKDTTTLSSSNGTFTIRTDGKNCMEAEFLPGDSVKCDSIVFIQTCKVSFWDGSKWVAKKPGDVYSGWGYRDGDTTADTTFVDHVFCEKDPHYNGDDPQDIGKKGSSGSSKMSFLKYSPAGPATPATMEDCPYMPDNCFPSGTSKCKMEFEVAAVCADDGKVLGSFNWEYNRAKADSGNGTDSVTTTGTAPDTVTAGFTAAKDTFVTNHTDSTGTTYCPEKRLLDMLKDWLDIFTDFMGYFPMDPIVGQTVTAQFTVINTSGEELTDLPVGFTVNGLQSGVEVIPLIPPYGSIPVEFSFVAEEGPNFIQCIADYYGDNEELDEHNNMAEHVIDAFPSSAVPIFDRFVLIAVVLGLILTAAFIIKKRVAS